MGALLYLVVSQGPLPQTPTSRTSSRSKQIPPARLSGYCGVKTTVAEVYNAQGQLIRKTSLDGREDISYTYANGRLAAMTDHFGRQLVFGYDAAGRLATMTDPGGGLYQYGYDTFEKLASVTYPDGTIRQYHYNEFGNDLTCGNQPIPNLLPAFPRTASDLPRSSTAALMQ